MVFETILYTTEELYNCLDPIIELWIRGERSLEIHANDLYYALLLENGHALWSKPLSGVIFVPERMDTGSLAI